MYNLILEGGDLLGKTTLIGNLQRKLPRAETRHCTPVRDESAWYSLMDYDCATFKVNASAGRHLLLDRWHGISELVYGNLDENEYMRKLDHVAYMLSTFCGGAAQVVILLAKEDLITARYNSRGDEFLTLEAIISCNEKYVKVALDLQARGVPVLVLNVEADNTDEILNTIYGRLTDEQSFSSF